MGFYVRKSIKAGPFRVNLSKSGVGVSGGVKGFRVGTGPRGNYVHLGRNGVYYRKFASTGTKVRGRNPSPALSPRPLSSEEMPSDIVMEDIQGATVVEMDAASSSELISNLNQAAARSPLNLIAWLRGHRSAAVFYDVNDEYAQRFERVIEAFDCLSRSQRVWHIPSRGKVDTDYQRKVNAGATSLVQRTRVAFTREAPKPMVTNIAVPGIAVRARSVHFLPDQLLIREGKTFATVPYSELKVECARTRFIEDETPPSDSQQVDTTWKYVNKKGGPDRRFKDNRQLPVMIYAEIVFSSASGLSTVLQASDVAAATAFADVLAASSA